MFGSWQNTLLIYAVAYESFSSPDLKYSSVFVTDEKKSSTGYVADQYLWGFPNKLETYSLLFFKEFPN